MDHLPECPAGYVADLCTTDIDPVLQEPSCNHCVGQGCICICDRLRACEKRIWKDPILAVAQNNGYTEALIDAREVVEAIRDALQTHYRIDCEPAGKVDWSQHRGCDPVDDILAAIDALKEKP